MPVAPGTWGSLIATVFAWFIALAFGSIGLLVAAVIVFVAGWWASEAMGRASGVKDSGSIVIDEVAGQWLTLAAAPVHPIAYGVGFLLFRLFDITKPWPAGWADRAVPGGLGVMLDDIFAAVYAAVSLFVLVAIWRSFFG